MLRTVVGGFHVSEVEKRVKDLEKRGFKRVTDIVPKQKKENGEAVGYMCVMVKDKQ